MGSYRRWLRLAFGGVVGLAVVAAVAAQPPAELPPIPPTSPGFPGALPPPAAPLPIVVEQPGAPIHPTVPAPAYRPLPSVESLFAPTITTERSSPPATVAPPAVTEVPPPAPPSMAVAPTPAPAAPLAPPRELLIPPAPPPAPVSTNSDPVLPPPEVPTGFYPPSVLPMPTLLPPVAPTSLSPALSTLGSAGVGGTAGAPGLPGMGGAAGGAVTVPCDPPAPHRVGHRKLLVDSLHCDDNYGLKSLFDSLHPEGEKGKHWYEKISLRGYTQFRFGRSLYQDQFGADPSLLGDRSINGNRENFSIRRMRLILFGDVSDHLGIYIQPDFGNTPSSSSTATFFGQLRDAYGDVYIDKTKIHRFRVGLSKIPYGWENLQSSQNRLPLDRTDPINTGASPNERDLGVFYYWTPQDKQKLFRDLVDGGLKGSGNYGIFGLGVYNGQGGSQLEQNLNLHTVARLTYPVQLASGQVVEASIQGYTGKHVVQGADIRPLGVGDAITPEGTGGTRGFRDQRVAGTFVWYPQPFGFQAEWNYGEGPGLDDTQQFVRTRPLQGGYVMAMYKHDTCRWGIITPYARWQYYRGGYRSVANAPYGVHDQWDLGVEWQIRKEMELVMEYSFVDGMNLNASDREGFRSYRNFVGGVLRFQFQVNY